MGGKSWPVLSTSVRQEFFHVADEFDESRFIREQNMIAAFERNEFCIRNRGRNNSTLLEWHDIVVTAMKNNRWRLDVWQNITDVRFIVQHSDLDGIFG